MAQSLSEGSVFNYTTTGAVANGELKVVGKRAGVALTSATGSGQVIALAQDGVFELTAHTTGALTIGNPAYVRATGDILRVVATAAVATGNVLFTRGAHTSATGSIRLAPSVGTIWETKASGARTAGSKIKVKLIGGPMPYV
jgi:predicted RecA/RadA family phage recombinase